MADASEDFICRCGRKASEHKPVDMDAIIKESAQRLADDIDRRVFERVMAQIQAADHG